MVHRRPIMASIAITGTLLVAWVDYVTGIEIRVFPLYFLPLAFAAWYLDKAFTIFTAILTSVLWIAMMYLAGGQYSHDYIWLVNFITQAGAFFTVALLLIQLHEALVRERAASRTDALTGLSNSRSFFEQSPNALALCERNARPVTIAYIDLDNFKHANDTMGHLHGDALLRKVADILRASLRASDIVARMGGDEFVVLLPETSVGEARMALEKVRGKIEQSPELKRCSVTASIGAVSFPASTSELQAILKAADELMYEVKKTGKNLVTVIQIGDR